MKRQRINDLTKTALMTVVICICSWITIPFVVPFTMQVFGVCVSLLLLGGIYGILAIGLYLLIGIIGIPVFSGFVGGFGHLLGPTGGYIIGFLFMGAIFLFFEKVFSYNSKVSIIALIIGLLVCYLIGTIWFVTVTGNIDFNHFVSAMSVCVLPYVVPDILKILLAIFVSKRVKKYI